MCSRYCGRRLGEEGSSPLRSGSECRRPEEVQTSTLLRASSSQLLEEELMMKLMSTTASPHSVIDCKMMNFVDTVVVVVDIGEQSVVVVAEGDEVGEEC